MLESDNIISYTAWVEIQYTELNFILTIFD